MPSLTGGDNSVKAHITLDADTSGAKEAEGAVDRFGKTVGSVSAKTVAAGQIMAEVFVAATEKIGQGLSGIVSAGFSFNSSVEQAQVKLMAFTKSQEKTAEVLSWVKDESMKTQFNFTDMADAAATLTPVANQTGKSIYELVKQAEVLGALNPAEGLKGAAFSIREAFSSDWVSLVERFNLPRNAINDLKAQGVPAMDIIAKTLKGMGVDYGLVSAQGQTVSARFETLKDKLTQLAGAASKPIFDRVSVELAKLSGVDLTEWGDKAADGIKNMMDWLERGGESVMKIYRAVADYLDPKLMALWDTIERRLGPSFMRLWREVIEPLIPVIGNLLVGAIGLAIDALNLVAEAMSIVIDGMLDGNPVIWGLIGLFGVLGTSMAVTQGVKSFQLAMATVTTNYAAFSAFVASPIVMPALLIGAAIASILVVQQYLDGVIKSLDRINADTDKALAGTDKVLAQANAQFKSGKISKERYNAILNGARAGGGDVVAGGAYAVGDNPDGSWNSTTEVFVPRTSGTIVSADKARSLLQQPSGGNKNINITQHIYNQVDYDKGLMELAWGVMHV